MEIKITYPDFVPTWLQFTLSLIISAVSIALLIASCHWAARDATARGKPGCLIGLFAFFTWPVGLLFWIIARPPATVLLIKDPSQKQCIHPGCSANAKRTGSILGSITYRCDSGHEFTEPKA